MLNIVCFKWTPYKDQKYSIPTMDMGIQYGPEYVNKLYRGLKRNIRKDFEWKLSLVTDEPQEDFLDPDINIIPLWDKCRDLGGCYNRLYTFSKDMKDILGERFICIDLDTVIVNDITHIVSVPDEFIYYRSPGPDAKGNHWPWRMNCGLYMMDAGIHHTVWSTFDDWNRALKIQDSRERHVGTDQAWCNYYFGDKLEHMPYWDKTCGIYDMRQDFIEKGRIELYDNTCMVTWPGPRDPSQSKFKQYQWIQENWK